MEVNQDYGSKNAFVVLKGCLDEIPHRLEEAGLNEFSNKTDISCKVAEILELEYLKAIVICMATKEHPNNTVYTVHYVGTGECMMKFQYDDWFNPDPKKIVRLPISPKDHLGRNLDNFIHDIFREFRLKIGQTPQEVFEGESGANERLIVNLSDEGLSKIVLVSFLSGLWDLVEERNGCMTIPGKDAFVKRNLRIEGMPDKLIDLLGHM